MEMTNQSATLRVRVIPSVRKMVQRAAKEEHMSISDFLRWIIYNELRRRGAIGADTEQGGQSK